jgi:hypothetical protein
MGAGRVQVNHGNDSSFERRAHSQHIQSAMQQKNVPIKNAWVLLDSRMFVDQFGPRSSLSQLP